MTLVKRVTLVTLFATGKRGKAGLFVVTSRHLENAVEGVTTLILSMTVLTVKRYHVTLTVIMVDTRLTVFVLARITVLAVVVNTVSSIVF